MTLNPTHSQDRRSIEQRALRISSFGALALAVLGFSFALGWLSLDTALEQRLDYLELEAGIDIMFVNDMKLAR